MKTLLGKTIILDNAEERIQLSGLANSVILKLERKRKPLTPGETLQLQFARTLWENCKQLNVGR
jgi:hypothetical protein